MYLETTTNARKDWRSCSGKKSGKPWCPNSVKDVKEQMMMRLDGIGESYDYLRAEVVSYANQITCSAIEEQWEVMIDVTHSVWPRIAEHAGFLLTRFEVGHGV